MYAEHWRKMGNFPILLVQSCRGALVNSNLLEYATVGTLFICSYVDTVDS